MFDLVEVESGSRAVADLPLELERDILELTARAFPESATRLALVAHRAQIWIEAIIYETVVLDFPQTTTALFLRTLSSRPPSFFRRTVKKLYLTSIVTFSQAHKVLSVCTGVTNLACWADAEPLSGGLFPLLASVTGPGISNEKTPRLERLSVKVESLWGGLLTSGSANFSHATFQRLTHLDIVNPPSYLVRTDWSMLSLLPALTHLAFGNLYARGHLHMVSVVHTLLDGCASLRVVVAISDDPLFVELWTSETAGDPRVVLVPQFHYPETLRAYWKGVRVGRTDFWGLANEVMEDAKSKQSGSRAG